MRFNILYLLNFILLFLMSYCFAGNKHSITANLKQAMPQYASIQKGYLEYYLLGNGSPIVLITGYGTDITSWNKQFLKKLAKEHQLVVFNNRNVGGSMIESDYYDIKDLAKDTYQLIQRLDLKKPAILGISMGGMIALQLAVLYPDKLGPLILINTAMPGKYAVRPTPSVEEMMLNMPTGKIARYFFALKLFFPASVRIPMSFALVFNRFLPAKYTEMEPKKVLSQQKKLILQWANDSCTGKKITQLPLPIFILNGEADAVIPPINSVILMNKLKNGRLKRWPNGGHAMIYQFPESIAEAINNFLAK